MKNLNLETLVNSGGEKLQVIAESVKTPKIKLVLGFLLKKLGEALIEKATDEMSESFVHGHVKATYVKESVSSNPDFSGDEIHKSLLQLIKNYETKMADSMPKKYSTKKAHYRFTITG